MIAKKVTIEELMPHIEVAFEDDFDLLNYFDKSADVKTIDEATQNVKEKIENKYWDAVFVAVEIDEQKVGYFVYYNNLLISFGMNKVFRRKEVLEQFSKTIKETIGIGFACCLFSYNERAIRFLQKMGMTISMNNVTILETCQSQPD